MRVGNGGTAGALRGVGGMLLALGAFLVFVRRSGHWTDFELLLTLAAPTALLYGLAIASRSSAAERRAEPWRAALLVTALVLLPLTLFQFLAWAGASTRHLLYDAAVLAAVGAAAIHGARRAAAPYAALLGGLALLGTWMLVWLKIFPHASADTVRVLILTGGVALLLASGAAAALDLTGGRELATAGAIGAIVAGSQGVVLTAVQAAIGGFGLFSEGGPYPNGLHLHVEGRQTSGWDIYLLIVSLALIWGATRSRFRGPGYVGALGIVAFLISVGGQLGRLAAGHAPSSSILGWPLVLVLLGLAGLAAPVVLRRRAR